MKLVSMMRFAGVAFLAGILAVGGFVLAARSGLLRPSEDALRARYGLPGSKFASIDGEPIHYLDEGRGEPVVLVHGSYGSLRMWDDWARILGARYRVIRFDRPPMGLSGPDPAGHYDPEREARIIGELATRLGVARFFLVGTSSAGASVTLFAAEHPDRIEGLILSNIAVGPLKPDPSRWSAWMRFLRTWEPAYGGWHTSAYWREVLRMNFADPDKVTPALATEWAELNNRAQSMPPAPDSKDIRAFFARTPGDLARISAPTLLLWSGNDPEVPADPVGREGLRLLGAADKRLEIVGHCGHMMPIECGAESAQVAAAFLDRVHAAAN